LWLSYPDALNSAQAVHNDLLALLANNASISNKHMLYFLWR
jgi:hypothetical protein